MISTYEELLQAAKEQPEPQRLLFVFCKAELPEDASEAEKADFERGEGGSLAPVVCVDKASDEVQDFNSLVEESRATGQDWDMVFVAALSGRGGIPPSTDEAQQPMTMMVESIRVGSVGNYIAVNRAGELVALA